MPCNRAGTNLLLGLDLVLIWTCVTFLGQYGRLDMSEKDNTESQGCCRKHVKALAAGATLVTLLSIVGILSLVSWLNVNKVPNSPFPSKQAKHNLFTYSQRYLRKRPSFIMHTPFQRSSINTGNEMQLHLIHAGLLTGAVCLDGSPPAYYLRKGKDMGANRWIIHFNGGAWCFDESACLERSRSSLGSSKNLPLSPPVIQGLNSPDPQVNPDFFDWNLVWVVYCDGASFTGNRESAINVDGEFIYFRGKRIIDAVFSDLLKKGFDNAERLILTGSSAGSMTAMFVADHIAKKYAPSIPVRVLSDAGFFVETSSMGGKNVGAMFKQIYDMQNSSTGLNEACLRAYGENHGWRCFLPEITFKYIKTPTFVLNAAYDVWALIYFMGINCKFPSNSYNRERRGINLLLPYLHSNKKNIGKERTKKNKSIKRPSRDISGFEMLPFFRQQASDRGSLPIYQPFDHENLYDPDHTPSVESIEENIPPNIAGDLNSPYHQPQYNLPGEKVGTIHQDTYTNNIAQLPSDFVNEQPLSTHPQETDQIDPSYGMAVNPTAFVGQTLSSNPSIEQGSYVNNINQGVGLVYHPSIASIGQSVPLQSNYGYQDIGNNIPEQSQVYNSRPSQGDQNIAGKPGKPINPFDSLVNALKNVTKKKVSDKNPEATTPNVMMTVQNMPSASHTSEISVDKSHVLNFVNIVHSKTESKFGSNSEVKTKKLDKTTLIKTRLNKPFLNKNNYNNLAFKSRNFKLGKKYLRHSVQGVGQMRLRTASNATLGNQTKNKYQGKRSTNIAREYISILRSDPPECTDTDMVDVMKYREAMLHATGVLRNSAKSGIFLVSCIDHSLSLFDETWSTVIVNGKTIAQAFGDWYFNRPTSHHDIDCPYPCNPSCP